MVNVKIFLAGFATSILLAAILSYLLSISFWICFILAASAMIINGYIAEYEDRKKGGFLNPEVDIKISDSEYAPKE